MLFLMDILPILLAFPLDNDMEFLISVDKG